MAHNVSDYLVLKDANKKLSKEPGGDIDWSKNFNLGNSANLNQRMILQFTYTFMGDASNLHLNFSINGKSIRTINATGNVFGSFHEIFSGNFLKHGNNKVLVKVTNGDGSVVFGDLLLWFQHTV